MSDFEQSKLRQDQGLSRRRFLKTSAMAGAGAAVNRLSVPSFAQRKAASSGKRKLGTLEVSGVGLGCQDFTGTFYATAPTRTDVIKLARTAHEQGVTLFDAAEAYGPLEVEKILGEALAPVRNEVVYSSKFGWDIDPETGKMMGGLNSRPDHIRRSIDAMLKRWRTDRVDLVYQHRVDPNVPIEDVAGTLKDLIAQGKVLHYGLSEPGPNTVRRAHAVHPVSAVQNEYSMLARGSEADIMPVCKELGIGFVCWSPLAMGFLTGTIDQNTQFQRGDFRTQVPWFTPDNRQGNMDLLGVVKKWAKRKNTTPARVALAWQLAREPWIVTIPGTTKMPHMLENSGAASVTLTPAEFAELNADLSQTPVHGERLSPGLLRLSGVEAPAKKA
jgi:aryl-alcohol dehydrogenase-like predicted oxidoreductase